MFAEGTIVIYKDVYQPKHSDALEISNHEVMLLLQSFASRGFVTEVFNWQYYYYILTDEGIKYLREYLGLPEDIVPATLKKTTVNAVRSTPRPNRFDGDDKRKFSSDRRGGERTGERKNYRSNKDV